MEITDEDGEVVAEVAEGIGVATNNVAEYTAAIRGLERARELGATRLLLRSDSRLLIEQLAGRWKVKNATLQRAPPRGTLTDQGVRPRCGSSTSGANATCRRTRSRTEGVDEWLAGEGASWERARRRPLVCGSRRRNRGDQVLQRELEPKRLRSPSVDERQHAPVRGALRREDHEPLGASGPPARRGATA